MNLAISNEQPLQKRLGAKGLIALITLLSAFVPLSTDLYLPALPKMGAQFDAPANVINLTLMLFFIFYSLGTLIWGPLSDKYGRRPVLAASGVLIFLWGRSGPWVFALSLLPASIAGVCMRPPGVNLMLNQQNQDTGSAAALIGCVGLVMGSLGMYIISFNWLNTVVFTAIHRHYQSLARRLSLDQDHSFPQIARQRVILLISGVHQGTLAGLRYARSISPDVTALYIALEPEDAQRIHEKWEVWGEGTRLHVVDSHYRLLIEPILQYIEAQCLVRQRNEVITVVVPQFVSHQWWSGLLHSQTAFMLRMALLLRPGVVIIEVPYLVD